MATIRKLESGNYQVQIRLKDLRPITRTFPTKTLATKFQREVEGDIKLQLALGAPIVEKITFREVVKLYLEQNTGRDPSITGRLNYWNDRFGDKHMTTITEFMVDDGLIELDSRVTGSTVNRYKSTLSAVFIYFIRHKKYKRLGMTNPVRKQSVSTYSENPAKERFLSDKEQADLLHACKESHWDKLYLLVLMALTTGARKGELLSLKWSDIDFQTRLASLETSKNGKPRMLPLTQPVIRELMKFREVGSGLIFASTVRNNTPYEISKPYANALRGAQVNDCRFHDLRHTAASNLAQNGASLLEIAEVLGHSTITMTQRYSHLCTEHKSSLIERVMGNLGADNG